MLEFLVFGVALIVNVLFERISELNDFPELKPNLADVLVVVKDSSGLVSLHHGSERLVQEFQSSLHHLQLLLILTLFP